MIQNTYDEFLNYTPTKTVVIQLWKSTIWGHIKQEYLKNRE